EDGDERGAARNRFQAKHLNRGGAAGYIAKYISKNIDGYALDGQLDNDTGKPLKDTAAAVTAWASTWRIPQFKTVGLPTMGAYRELRKLPRGVSIADEFDERVEAARAAADSGDFALYISAQGGANVPRDCQTVRVARSPSDDVNEYEEEVERVVGIYAPHLGARHIHITRTTDWRIVPKVPVVEPLTLKSGIAAPRSPVNNCGKLTGGDTSLPAPTPTEHAAAVLNLIDEGILSWTEPGIMKVLRDLLSNELKCSNRSQQSFTPFNGRSYFPAPSARLTRQERKTIPKIKVLLAQSDIQASYWELEALARGAVLDFGHKRFKFDNDIDFFDRQREW
ncbi:replication endonuclease, partial [Escherichia coli]|nr:replication endonuclease [Escherichia coli]